MPVFLGLDCGGSTCRALAIDEDDKAIFSGQSGPANLASTPAKILERNLLRALEGCPSPDLVCGCFAGLLTEQDRSRAERLMHERFPDSRVRAEADYAAAFMAADPGTHACVVAGTGSVICSRVGERFVKSGGRGYLLGDFGSAFRLGQAAAQEFVSRGKDNASPDLRAAIEERFETLDEAAVVARLYRSVSPVAQIAKLAPAFARDYENEVPYARAALRDQFGRLAAETNRHLRKHFGSAAEWHVALTGGVWEMSSLFQPVFQEQLSALGGTCTFSRPRLAPIRGAVRLARETYYGN